MKPTIRIGVPKTTGSLWATVEALDAPALVSAGSMWNHAKHVFRQPGQAINGHDVALDSAGFVAHSHWGGFPWSVRQYVELASTIDWAWWAQMDCCVEPEIASDENILRYRIFHTARLLDECIVQSRQLSIKRPVPVLQGWDPLDYELSYELADQILGGKWPQIVGVGSVCRREISGPHGIAAIAAHLHQLVPRHCTLHFFGAKSGALQLIDALTPGRTISTDSQAWGNAARYEALKRGTACTIKLKSKCMVHWWNAQHADQPVQLPILLDNPQLNPPYFWEACCLQPENISCDPHTNEFHCASCGEQV